jgi:cystathionine gamma-synthase
VTGEGDAGGRALRPETLAAQADHFVDPVTGSVVPAIDVSTTYARDDAYDLIGGLSYGRDDNPTYLQAEALLAKLEGGAAAKLFASGLAAIAAVFQTLRPGDHAVVPAEQYFGTLKLLRALIEPMGVAVDYVPAGDLDALAAAVRPGVTRLVYIETPANPTWAVTDIAGAAAIAHAAGAELAVDSTAATPVLTRPIEHGADLVVHSATKYLNGHSDVLAGAIVTAAETERWARIGTIRALGGAVLGPFEAFLLLRGMRTLYLRVRQASATAQAIAEAVDGHRAVSQVCYPGLPAFPGHAVAARQMAGGFGGMLSLRLAGGRAASLDMLSKVAVFTRATSLGGVESLIEHRWTIEQPHSSVPEDLVRLSVGIEAADDLIGDLVQALDPQG